MLVLLCEENKSKNNYLTSFKFANGNIGGQLYYSYCVVFWCLSYKYKYFCDYIIVQHLLPIFIQLLGKMGHCVSFSSYNIFCLK